MSLYFQSKKFVALEAAVGVTAFEGGGKRFPYQSRFDFTDQSYGNGFDNLPNIAYIAK